MREKRFVLKNKTFLKNRWFVKKGQLLNLTYTYSKEALKKPDYIEMIEVAVENFNQLGLAILTHEPLDMGMHSLDCPLDVYYLKEKYKNQIIFELKEPDNHQCTSIMDLMYSVGIKDLRLIAENASDFISLPPFAHIACNVQSRFLPRFGIGVILHEINHLFGLEHSHTVAETNGILTNNRARPNVEEILADNTLPLRERWRKIQKINTIFARGIPRRSQSRQIVNYTLISPFSMQHYPITSLLPFRSLNNTRINEILDEYKFTPELKIDYLYLLDKYVGYPIVYTYQDITALATAIYSIAPDSLVKKNLALPYYHLVEGIYKLVADEEKLIHIMERLREAEGFTYPIFAQENIVLRVDGNNYFEASLLYRLKIVSLNREIIHCHFSVSPSIAFPLRLSTDCILTGQSKESGDFYFNITINNNMQLIQRKVTLRVMDELIPKHRVLLANSQPSYLLQADNVAINFIQLCQATAYPKASSLNCSLTEVVKNLSLENCTGEVEQLTEDYNVTIIFANGQVNKSCYIQLLSSQSLMLDIENPTFNISANELENNYTIPAVLPLYHAGKKPLQQLAHLLAIPAFQGLFEGVVDSININNYYKILLNLIPRISLLVFGYTNPLSFGIASLSALISGFVNRYLQNTQFRQMESYINFIFFALITELEYAPSKLWELTGKIEFFPEAIEILNQLSAQMLIAPAMKTVGYLAGISFMKSVVLPSATPISKEVITELKKVEVECDQAFAKKSASFPLFWRTAASNSQRADSLNRQSTWISLA